MVMASINPRWLRGPQRQHRRFDPLRKPPFRHHLELTLLVHVKVPRTDIPLNGSLVQGVGEYAVCLLDEGAVAGPELRDLLGS